MNIEFKISKKPVNYKKALKFIENRVKRVKKGEKELVWLLEHPLTYTAGIRFNEDDILDKSIRLIKFGNSNKLRNNAKKSIFSPLGFSK